MNRYFSKVDTQMAHSHMKRMFKIAIFREMQMKIKMRYHLTQVSEWLSTKRPQITNIGEDVEKRELLYTVGGHVNW